MYSYFVSVHALLDRECWIFVTLVLYSDLNWKYVDQTRTRTLWTRSRTWTRT